MQSHHRKIGLGALSIAAAMGLVLTGCSNGGGSTDGGDSAASGESHTFDFTMHTGENDTISRVNQKFIDEVAEKSDGRITINPHFAGSLFGPDQVLEAVETGTVDIGLQTTSFASGAIPDLAVLEVPFGGPAEPEAVLEFHEGAQPILEDIFSQHNQQLVFTNPAIMPGVILCNTELPADVDLSGKLVRTAGPWQGAVMEAWGGTPVTMGTAELYTALQNKTVDCALQVYNLVDSLKLAEVAPYIYRLDFGANFNAVNMNQQAWDSLSEEDQQILLEAGIAARDYAIELLQSEGQPLMDSMIASGGQFCRPTDAVIEDKVKSALTVRPAMEEAANSPAGAELIALSDSFQDRMVFTPTYGPTDACK